MTRTPDLPIHSQITPKEQTKKINNLALQIAEKSGIIRNLYATKNHPKKMMEMVKGLEDIWQGLGGLHWTEGTCSALSIGSWSMKQHEGIFCHSRSLIP